MTTRAVESRSQRLVRLQALSEWSRCRRGVEWSLAKGFKRRLSEPSCERRYCFSSERSPSLRPVKMDLMVCRCGGRLLLFREKPFVEAASDPH